MFLADLSIYKKLSNLRSGSFAGYLKPLIDNGSQVLDFGCGNMYTAAKLLELNPSLDITGVDVVRDQNLSDELLSNPQISFIENHKKELPFPDDTFDVALALATMHHTFSPEYYLSELKRVTKPGGHLIMVEEMFVNKADKLYISAQDWLLNKMKKGIPIPLNFKSNAYYLEEFKKQGLEILFTGSVRPLPTLMHHYVYKLLNHKSV